MRYLLDTNVVSELRKARSGRCDKNVAEWVAGRELAAIFVSVLTVYELERGVLLKSQRDPTQGLVLRHWLAKQLAETFHNRVLPVSPDVAQRCAALNVPNRGPLADTLIAATALVHGMIVVTRNVSDFERTGVRLLNPWNG